MMIIILGKRAGGEQLKRAGVKAKLIDPASHFERHSRGKEGRA